MIYFFNALRVSHGGGAVYYQQGAPVHLIGAIIAAVARLGPLDAGRFLMIAYGASLGALAAAWFAIYFATSDGSSLVVAPLPLWIYCLSPGVFLTINLWSHDVWQFPAAAAIFLSWLALYKTDGSALKQSLIAGLAGGVGVGLKILFLPMAVGGALAAFILSRQRRLSMFRTLGCYGGGMVVGFVASTFPTAKYYTDFGEWIVALAVRRGPYGTGSIGVPAIRLHWWLVALQDVKNWPFIAATVIAAAWLARAHEGRSKLPGGVAVSMLVTLILSVMIIIRDPNWRYIMPAAAFVSFAWIFIAREMWAGQQRFLAAAVVAVTVAGVASGAAHDVQQYRLRVQQKLQTNASMEKFLRVNGVRQNGKRVAWIADTPAYAARFGDWMSDGMFRPEVDHMFPMDSFFPYDDATCDPVEWNAVHESLTGGRLDVTMIADDYWASTSCRYRWSMQPLFRGVGWRALLNQAAMR